MIRHPRYLEIPWQAHWDGNERRPHHHVLFMLILIFMAMFLIGVGVISGLM
jgi:hypothetical protein